MSHSILFLRLQSGSIRTGAPPAEVLGGGKGIENGRVERDLAKVEAPVKLAVTQRIHTKSLMGGK